MTRQYVAYAEKSTMGSQEGPKRKAAIRKGISKPIQVSFIKWRVKSGVDA